METVAEDNAVVGGSGAVRTHSRGLVPEWDGHGVQDGEHDPLHGGGESHVNLALRVFPSVRHRQHVRSPFGRQGKFPLPSEQHTETHSRRGLVSKFTGVSLEIFEGGFFLAIC